MGAVAAAAPDRRQSRPGRGGSEDSPQIVVVVPDVSEAAGAHLARVHLSGLAEHQVQPARVTGWDFRRAFRREPRKRKLKMCRTWRLDVDEMRVIST